MASTRASSLFLRLRSSVTSTQLSARLHLRIILVSVFALALRVWFIEGGEVVGPVRGDAVQYCSYAWNLVQSHVFSMAMAGSESIVPDSYRDPGYPSFLAGFVAIWGFGDTWYVAVLLAQALLGALSAGLAMSIAAKWLGSRATLLVGLAVAVWPHNVAISGFLLSETLFGFMVLLALWLLSRAVGSAGASRWALAGMGFGAAAMVNATLAPFCTVLALGLMAAGMAPKRLLAALLLGSLVLPGAWTMRALSLPAGASSGNRAMTNLVQGSWSDYHSAYIYALRGDPKAKQILENMDADIRLGEQSPSLWLSQLAQRVRQDPVHYISWYAWKPELLWAWNIRIGGNSRLPIGDIYPYPIRHPIYMSYQAMQLFESFCIGINPLLFVLMAATVAITLARQRRRGADVALYATALLVAYETVVYSILQSEPRYSIPFRPLEMMLTATAVRWLWQCWQQYAARSKPAAALPGSRQEA